MTCVLVSYFEAEGFILNACWFSPLKAERDVCQGENSSGKDGIQFLGNELSLELPVGPSCEPQMWVIFVI